MAEVKKPSYKYCMVPECKNTIISTPSKKFFRIPRDAKLRKKWCKVMKKDNVSPLSVVFCCEDHFNIKEDTANYVEYNIMKHERDKCSLRLKKGVVPHIFLCQKQNMPKSVARMGAVKRQSLAHVNEALGEYAIKSGNILENGELPEIIEHKVSAGPNAGSSSSATTYCYVLKRHTGFVKMPQVVSSKTSLQLSPKQQQSNNSNSKSLLLCHHLKEQEGESSRSPITSQPEKSERNIRFPEAKEIITNVYQYLQTEYEYLNSYISSDCDLTPLGNILKRTAEATGVSEETVTTLLETRKRPLESTHKTVRRKHSNSSYYSSFEDENLSFNENESSCEDSPEDQHTAYGDEQYTSRVETLQVEFEECEDQRSSVNEKIWVKVEATPSESTLASRSLLSRSRHIKVEPFDLETEHKLPLAPTPLRKRRQSNIGRKTRNATRVAKIRRRARQSRTWQLQPEGLVTTSAVHPALPSECVEIKQEPSDIEYCHQNEQVNDVLERLKMEFEEEENEDLENDVRRRSNVEATTSNTQHADWLQDIDKETINSQEQLNTTLTRDFIKKSKNKERQQRYREKNREKLKRSEAERRKRKRCLQIATGLSSSRTNVTEESIKQLIDADSHISSGLEDSETTSIVKKIKQKYVLERRRERQRIYREKNREKLKQREAERRQRLLGDRNNSGSRSTSAEPHVPPDDVKTEPSE